MDVIPQGVVTIRSVKYNECMFSGEDKHDKDRRHVCTAIGSACPPGPTEASRWNIVFFGGAFRIQNVMTKEWMYANVPTYDTERRRVLTFNRNGAEPPEKDLACQWHIVRYGACFGLKNAKRDEWVYANEPKLSDKCRHVLAWVPGGNDPKADPSARWLIEAVDTNICDLRIPAHLEHESQRTHKVVRIESSGYDSGNMATFFLDEIPIGFNSQRGLNIAILDPISLKVLSTCSYDIYETYADRDQFAVDIAALPVNHIVLAALKDSGMEKLDLAHISVLRSLGATISKGKFREGYALIGINGGRAVAEAQGNAVSAMGTIYNKISPSPGMILKLKHQGVFYRAHIEEGDRCIINKATLLDFLTTSGQELEGKRLLKLEMEVSATLSSIIQQPEQSACDIQSNESSKELESSDESVVAVENVQ